MFVAVAIFKLTHTLLACASAELRDFVSGHHGEIATMLLKIPSELLLLLKTQDCLRAVDISLGR